MTVTALLVLPSLRGDGMLSCRGLPARGFCCAPPFQTRCGPDARKRANSNRAALWHFTTEGVRATGSQIKTLIVTEDADALM